MTRHQVGIVRELWRYPVKSMLGEQLGHVAVGEGGLQGDRGWALRDPASANIVTAKICPRLLDFQATGTAAGTVISLPGGATVAASDPGASRAVSESLGMEVLLEPATAGLKAKAIIDPATVFGDVPVADVLPGFTNETLPPMFRLLPGTFFDSGAVHIFASGTLQHLRALSPTGTVIDRCRYRPNIFVESAPGLEGFVEDAWAGATLVVGDTLRIVDLKPALRCIMTTHAQGDLPRDPGILRTVARHHQSNAGVFASVAVPGIAQCGDPVFIES